MIPLNVTATLRSPVHLGARNTAANFLAGLGYIPGRALLGAAAWACIDRGDAPEALEFSTRFVSGEVSWGDLRLVPLDETGMPITGLPIVAPRTAETCKLFGLRH